MEPTSLEACKRLLLEGAISAINYRLLDEAASLIGVLPAITESAAEAQQCLAFMLWGLGRDKEALRCLESCNDDPDASMLAALIRAEPSVGLDTGAVYLS
jgi:type III secretion system SsaH family protein